VFATIGHTFELMKMSWRVLMQDRELIFFPILAGVSLLILIGVFLAIGSTTGTLDRLDALSGSSTAEEEAQAVDIVLGLAFVFASSAIVIFFNAALIAAALERLRGGDPNISSGLRAASAHLPQILAWALISVVVSLLLRALRERGGIGGQIASLIGGVAWGLATFFVIPVLVTEGVGPIEAIKRSSGLLRQTWGRQFAANFGFGIITIGAVLIAVLGRRRDRHRAGPRGHLQGRALRLRPRRAAPRLRPRDAVRRLPRDVGASGVTRPASRCALARPRRCRLGPLRLSLLLRLDVRAAAREARQPARER
jgi:hypothetical protein